MIAVNLKTEHLINPVGIDCSTPELFWNCEGGVYQSAYRILAEDDEGTLLYDSGKVISNEMHAVWGGKPVQSETKVIWKVRLYDENDVCSEWSEAFFETGLSDWKAKWITGNYKVNRKERYPADCFRKEFNVSDVRKARLYITACGIYEAHLNGRRAGDVVLAPGITEYRKRVQYQTYDVTDLIQTGLNVLDVQLADGWYRGCCGAWGLRNQYGTQTKFLAQLKITHTDGSETIVVSDDTWSWSNDGPIRSADLQDGEVVDASMSPSYNGKAKITQHKGTLHSSDNVPVKEHEHLKPVQITSPSGKCILDFRQNIAGYAEFTITAKKGQRVFLRFGELIDENGEFTQRNIQLVSKHKTTPLQQVEYICREGVNHYKTSFAIFGFQYIQVETDASFEAEDFTAIAVYSDLKRTGWFESSNALLNQFVENTVWSAKNNHADLPTDCPTRERHGWSGDAQIFCSTASWLFDYDAFARKYERDLVDSVRRNGCFRQIVPTGGIDFYMNNMDGSPGWSDAGVFIPYDLYKRYGDVTVLKENYDAMTRYVQFKIRTLGKWYMTSLPTGIEHKYRKWISNYGQSYGEWAEPVDVKAFAIADFINPHPEETTAYIVLLLERMSEIETVLGHKQKAQEYLDTAEKVRRGYQALMESKKHSLDTDRQAKLVRPLYMHLLNEQQKAYAEKRLLEALDHYQWRLGTGFLSTPLILYVLADLNPEYAYRLLENEEIPGWLSMPKNGATTIWESWEGKMAQGGVASLNHYSKGAVVQWLFDSMCGITIERENRIVIRPIPGGSFTYAKAVYDSVYGRVESGWKRDGEHTEFTVTVPSNCTAEIHLPDGSAYTQTSGTKTYSA